MLKYTIAFLSLQSCADLYAVSFKKKHTHTLLTVKGHLFAQILELQGHKNTLSYIKHQILSTCQQYKLVKLCCLRYLYKPT